MAAVLSETFTEHTHFPTMGRGDEHQRSPEYRQSSRTRSSLPPSPRFQPRDAPPSPSQSAIREPHPSTIIVDPPETTRQPFASQQHFSSPSNSSHTPSQHPPANAIHQNSAQRPHLASPAASVNSPIARSNLSSDDLQRYGGSTIKVRDLAHIQSFANEEFLSQRGQGGRRRTGSDPPLNYEISSMPITDIIEMVAGLLTKITTTNDRQHENLHRPIPSAETAANLPGLTSSVLAFHGKNVPSITILSYLSRIHKYCPTTYEVFLSLLVYFDRMTERVNAAPMAEMRRGSSDRNPSRPSTGVQSVDGDGDTEIPRTPVSGSSIPSSSEELTRAHYATPPDDDQIPYNLSHFFVVDSFNIHRLVIAGVTCASKFFSDVFYTNSRYAKASSHTLFVI
jgi:hypothetical protein